MMSDLQKKLLSNASDLLAKNGTIIYSTCSLEPEENEKNVEFATRELDLETVKINMNFGFETKSVSKNQDSIRIMPYKSRTQGFFACILRR